MYPLPLNNMGLTIYSVQQISFAGLWEFFLKGATWVSAHVTDSLKPSQKAFPEMS